MTGCYIKNNKLYDKDSDSEIKDPHIVTGWAFDGYEDHSDELFCYGTSDEMFIYQRCLGELAPHIPTTMISLTLFNVTQQAYIITRMIDYPNTGFVKNFDSKCFSPDRFEWLEQEMLSFPVNISIEE